MNFTKLKIFPIYNHRLDEIQNVKKCLINTINAHSFNVTQSDNIFKEVLLNSDILIPDGVSIIWAMRLLTGKKLQKISGTDLFFYEMDRINAIGGKCFFIGSTEETLDKIRKRAALEYPKILVFSFSPPYKPEFTDEENRDMIRAVNAVEPEVLFVGMTAPKQEKWAYKHFSQLQVGHVCCIGAVFDFYAGTVSRAPQWMINIGLEWFYRLIKEPRRMWRRYLIGNVKFIGYILKEKFSKK